MNAPPGVDTDTSGEEFTPPPSPKAESPKAEFSLTSLLPTQRLRKLRKANAKIKTQTPEQACEKDGDPEPERKHTRLTKKRVRIVDNTSEPGDAAVTPPLEDAPEDTPEETIKQAVAHLPPSVTNDRDPTQVIALLRQMMAKNAVEDEVEAGVVNTEGIDSTTTLTPDPIDTTKPSSPDDIQLPTPIGPSFAKRRPGGLDFSSLFKTRGKSKPPPSTANPPGHFPSHTDLSVSTGTSSSISQPTVADPPKSAPSWLWAGPNVPTAGPSSQPYSPAPPPAMSPTISGYPPWLWAGPAQAQGGQQPAVGDADRDRTHPYASHLSYAPQTHAALPPFPPYYPHPQSLQPWQPYYPPWTAPTQQYPGQSPYDGIAETSPPGAKAEFFAQAPSWQTPDPSLVPPAATQSGPQSRAETQKIRPKPEGPKLRPPAVLSNRPVQTDAASIAESTIPEQGVHEEKSSKDIVSETLDRKLNGHIKKALRTVGMIPTSENTSQKDTHPVAISSSESTNSPTWTECLLSLATCIHLGEKLLKHMEAEKGASSKHKGHFYRLLTKVLASLLSQRNVVEDMTKVVGSDHGDEISHFAEEIHTISKFFKSRLHKRSHSSNDTKRLSNVHGQAARSLEAGGLTHLLGQVFTLTDFLTPAVIKIVTGLLRDWADDQLTAKSVMKALMSIQREVAEVHQQQKVTGAISKDDAGDVWTLLKYVDLLYGLFVSDNDVTPSDPHDTIPGAWPPEPTSSRKASSGLKIAPDDELSISSRHDTPAPKHHHGVVDTSRSKGKEADKLPSPSHRSPRQVMSDLVHPKRSDSRDAKEKVRSDSSIPTVIEASSGQDPTIVKQPISKPTKHHKPESLPLPDIKVEPYRRSPSTKTSNKSAVPVTPKIRSTTPTIPLATSPQSSPSQYSQDEDDASSEGTVSSDEDARSLLAQADSGPKRVAPLNIRKKSHGVEKQEIDRAKQLMSG